MTSNAAGSPPADSRAGGVADSLARDREAVARQRHRHCLDDWARLSDEQRRGTNLPRLGCPPVSVGTNRLEAAEEVCFALLLMMALGGHEVPMEWRDYLLNQAVTSGGSGRPSGAA